MGQANHGRQVQYTYGPFSPQARTADMFSLPERVPKGIPCLPSSPASAAPIRAGMATVHRDRKAWPDSSTQNQVAQEVKLVAAGSEPLSPFFAWDGLASQDQLHHELLLSIASHQVLPVYDLVSIGFEPGDGS